MSPSKPQSYLLSALFFVMALTVFVAYPISVFSRSALSQINLSGSVEKADEDEESPSSQSAYVQEWDGVKSFAPDVYLQDITWTIRNALFRSIMVSRHDPKSAYVGSQEGWVFWTRDGGETWDENRVIYVNKPFFGDNKQKLYYGNLRKGTGWRGPGNRSFEGSDRTQRAMLGPYGRARATPGNAMNYPQARMNLTRMRYNGISIDVGGGRGGAASNTSFGTGLPGGAPRLQVILRKYGKATAGLNLQQLLVQTGSRTPEVRIIVEHPTRPGTLYAATLFGLFETHDWGNNWVRTFIGVNRPGRAIFHVVVDPLNPDRLLMATGEGLYVSEDAGESFTRSTEQGVGSVPINWIYVNPYDPRYIFALTSFGLLRSSNSGKTWEWIYFTTFPLGKITRYLSIDPFNHNRAYLVTHDGAYMTDNILHGGLDDWRRLGGLYFTSYEMAKIEACPKHKGHMWTFSFMKVPGVDSRREPKTGIPNLLDAGGAYMLESVDGGKKWDIIWAGETKGNISWFDNDPRDPDLLWLVWSRQLARMRRNPGGTKFESNERLKRPDIQRKIAQMEKEDPPVDDVLAAAMKYTTVEYGAYLSYRSRSRLRAFFPRVDLTFNYYNQNQFSNLQDGIYASTLPFFKRDQRAGRFTEFRGIAMWDFSPLVFDLETTLFGRVARVTHELQTNIRGAAVRFYSELRRIRRHMILHKPKEFVTWIKYLYRLEEIESYIDYLTGGYLSRYRATGDVSGWDTKTWEIWDGPHKYLHRMTKSMIGEGTINIPKETVVQHRKSTVPDT